MPREEARGVKSRRFEDACGDIRRRASSPPRAETDTCTDEFDRGGGVSQSERGHVWSGPLLID